MTKLLFWIENYGGTIDDAEEFEIKWFNGDIESATSKYAEHYHNNRDGWESSWPLEFSVADENGKFLGRVSVEREMEPVFYGRTVKPKTQAERTCGWPENGAWPKESGGTHVDDPNCTCDLEIKNK